ncbi:hypothetical protein [Microbacterium sp. NPDC076895]|uniref:hypothetical protein n=1 Tax=Microbacterium sp. NPDC076895 TaxID=3154957 RepID=UPI003442C8BF
MSPTPTGSLSPTASAPLAPETATPSPTPTFALSSLAQLCVDRTNTGLNINIEAQGITVHEDHARAEILPSGRWLVEVPHTQPPRENFVGGESAYVCAIGNTPQDPEFNLWSTAELITDQEWEDAINGVGYYGVF